MKKNICALIVTYNRKTYLNKLLNMLKDIKELSGIFIFDNYSSDGTPQLLIDMGIINNVKEKIIIQHNNNIRYYYYRNNENTGGAGGFYKGLDLIHKMHIYDYIWIMDDDVFPDKNCLKELIKFQDNDTMITIPNRTDENYEDKVVTKMNLSNPFKILENKKTKGKVNDLKSSDKIVEVVDMPFEGPLINCELINKIGLPDKKYFIIYDDTDYAIRAIRVTKIKFVKEAILHKQIISKSRKKYMNWKDYYGYRNDILFCRKYGRNNLVKYLTPILVYVNLMAKCIIKRKWKNIKIINMACRDGYFGKSGKTVNPGEM